jgi:hypothetical protein
LERRATEHTLNGFLGSLETKANALPEPVTCLAGLITRLCGLFGTEIAKQVMIANSGRTINIYII